MHNLKGIFERHWFKFAIIGLVLLALIFLNSYLQGKNELANLQFQEQKIQKDKEFDANQKEACLAIYKQESAKWNNTDGWSYNEFDNTCHIEYKATTKKTKAQCDAEYKGEDGKVFPIFFTDWLLCQDGLFEKTF